MDTHLTGPIADLSSDISAELLSDIVPQTEDMAWFNMFLGIKSYFFGLVFFIEESKLW